MKKFEGLRKSEEVRTWKIWKEERKREHFQKFQIRFYTWDRRHFEMTRKGKSHKKGEKLGQIKERKG